MPLQGDQAREKNNKENFDSSAKYAKYAQFSYPDTSYNLIPIMIFGKSCEMLLKHPLFPVFGVFRGQNSLHEIAKQVDIRLPLVIAKLGVIAPSECDTKK